ncbi:MAG: hypothetical protein QF473_26060 [Planctomycetota bacterium]|nr:hypothetical protein [Planctomycetota bacterium]
MKYSERLGQIRNQSFQLALDRFGLGDFVSAQAIPHGLFGQNVFLTSTEGEYVFRGHPLYRGQFETERFMAERLHKETDAPVPWPYLVDGSDDIFGWAYTIMWAYGRKEGWFDGLADFRSYCEPFLSLNPGKLSAILSNNKTDAGDD